MAAGVPTVGFLVISDWFQHYGKFFFILLAAFCASIIPYLAWRKERKNSESKDKKIETLEEKLKPKLILSFDPSNRTCVTPVPNGYDQEATAFRLKVESNSHERITGCSGKLLSISTPFGIRSEHQFLQLTFTPSSSPDTTSKILDYQAPIYLDIANVFQDNRIEIPIFEPLPNGEKWDAFFNDRGEYIFEILVTSDSGPPVSCKLKLLWTEDWRATKMQMIS